MLAPDIKFYKSIMCRQQTLDENKNFRLTKISEKERKDHIFVSSRVFPFHANVKFSELFLKRKCKKAVSFRKYVFLCKYDIFE